MVLKGETAKMIIHTASEGISLVKELESESGAFYESLAGEFPHGSETFLSFARENKKNITQVERAYYGVISDAIEGCFAFNLDTANYVLDLNLPPRPGYRETVERAKKIEEKIIQCYNEAAEQSGSLMADVPRSFTLIARKRQSRLAQLDALLNSA
jgi:hypothetical protein